MLENKIKNKIICGFKRFWYFLYETIRLKYERRKYKKENNEENPLITVYTPTYNRGSLLLERAITSVLSQTYKNIEYIIVGDGCTDDTERIVDSIHDKRIRFYNIERKRPEHNYDSEKEWFLSATYPANFALKKVKGKYITKIDDDDMWHPNHLRDMLYYLKNSHFEFVSCGHEEIRYGLRNINEGIQLSTYLQCKSKRNDSLIGGHSSWMYKSYLKFMKYNPQAWRKKWNRVDDTDLLERMYKRGVFFGFLNKILTYIYPRPGEKTIGLESVKNKMKKRVKNNERS